MPDHPSKPKETHPLPIIDPKLCDGCNLCILVCPTQSLILDNGKAAVKDRATCNYHGVCELICPLGAISRKFKII